MSQVSASISNFSSRDSSTVEKTVLKVLIYLQITDNFVLCIPTLEIGNP